MPDLTDKVAIITGASSGIGEGTAIHFAQLGCSLCLTGRDESKLEDVKKQCLDANSKIQVIVIKADLTKEDENKRVIETTVSSLGKINILVNCAGIVVTGAVLSTSIESYDKVMDINVRSIVLLTQAALPHIIQSKGTIVNVSSINGICSFPNVSYYCMSKGALDQFTKCLALEMAPKGVRVNSVNPGVVVTNVHKRAGMDDKQYEAFLEHSKTTHALGRVGTTSEVAKAIAFLASDDSTFTTGQLLRVDGGRGIMSPR